MPLKPRKVSPGGAAEHSWLGDHFLGSSKGLQTGGKGTLQMQEVKETGKDHTCRCGVQHRLGGCGKASLVGGTEEIGKQVRRQRSKAGEQRPQEKEAKSLDTQHISHIQSEQGVSHDGTSPCHHDSSHPQWVEPYLNGYADLPMAVWTR